MKYTYIAGTGSYVPDEIISNFALEKMIDTSDEWIRTRTGIVERRIAGKDEATSDLAVKAAQLALEDAGLEANDLDLIITATVTPDMLFPSTGCMVQKKIEAQKAAAFDISAACSGFLYALEVGDQLIKSGQYHNILVLGADTLSKITDWTDRNTCVLFGDGAGAVILRAREENQGVLCSHLFSDGAMSEMLQVPAGGSLRPASEETVQNRLHYISMKGNEIFKTAIKAMTEAIEQAAASGGIPIDTIDFFIFHQANTRIINAVAQRLSIPENKIPLTIQKYGNTSTASMPITLDELNKAGKIHRGDIICFAAFGGGLTWASSLVKW
ncbi:MAG: ketoacyl-ACP synthase III [Deltaproteobacteria bacterium]|nr:ketoacyl-ACP synthase III [Deltaproteobacteria bacterium]